MTDMTLVKGDKEILIDPRTKKPLFPIEVDILTGNMLLQNSYGTLFPERIDKRTFTPNIRKTMSKKFLALYRCLKEKSPIVREEKILTFGPRDQYQQQDVLEGDRDDDTAMNGEMNKKRYLMLSKTFKVRVLLTESAKDGLYWLLYLFLHPASKGVLPPGMQEEFVFPLAEQIGAVAGLEKITGGEAKESIEPTYDEDVTDSTPTEIGVESKEQAE